MAKKDFQDNGVAVTDEVVEDDAYESPEKYPPEAVDSFESRDAAQTADIEGAWRRGLVLLRLPLNVAESENRIVLFENGRVIADFRRVELAEGGEQDFPTSGVVSLVNDRPSMESLINKGFIRRRGIAYNTITREIIREELAVRNRKAKESTD